MIGLLISLVITGLIVGALGRLAVPGPNPMSIGMTILVGIGGSLVAGLISRAIFGKDSTGAPIIIAVLVTAAIVYLMQRRQATT
jgi:uncharacterized membrane protein YeaQ/YmgE (transglycosylase-associated protein family)